MIIEKENYKMKNAFYRIEGYRAEIELKENTVYVKSDQPIQKVKNKIRERLQSV